MRLGKRMCVRMWMCAGVAAVSMSAAARAQLVDPNDPAEEGGVLAPEPLVKPAEPEPAAEDPQTQAGRAIMRRASEAMRAAGGISYTAVSSAEGGLLENTNPFTRALVRGRRVPAGTRAGVWLIRATGSGSQGKNKEPREFDVSWKQRSVEWVDHEARKVHESNVTTRTGPAFQIGTGSKFDDMLQPVPLRDQLNAERFVIEGRETINGVECDVMLVEMAGNKKQRWAIGVSDSLPRRVDRLIESSILNGHMRLDLLDVAVFPIGSEPFSAEQLSVSVPEGYAEDRPPPPPVRPTPAARPANEGSVVKQPGTGDGMDPSEEAKIAAANAEAAVPPTPPAPVVEDAPMFEVTTIGGETISLESVRGKVLVIDFYGSWCVPAPAWHRELRRAAEEYGERGVVFLIAAVREKSDGAAAEYVREHEITLPAVARGDAVAQAFGAQVYPCTVVVDPAGRVVTRIQGARAGSSGEELRGAIGEGLGEVVEKE